MWCGFFCVCHRLTVKTKCKCKMHRDRQKGHQNWWLLFQREQEKTTTLRVWPLWVKIFSKCFTVYKSTNFQVLAVHFHNLETFVFLFFSLSLLQWKGLSKALRHYYLPFLCRALNNWADVSIIWSVCFCLFWMHKSKDDFLHTHTNRVNNWTWFALFEPHLTMSKHSLLTSAHDLAHFI